MLVMFLTEPSVLGSQRVRTTEVRYAHSRQAFHRFGINVARSVARSVARGDPGGSDNVLASQRAAERMTEFWNSPTSAPESRPCPLLSFHALRSPLAGLAVT